MIVTKKTQKVRIKRFGILGLGSWKHGLRLFVLERSQNGKT